MIEMMVRNEKMIIQEIFERGYQHAAKSFSSLTGLEIKSGGLNIELGSNTEHLPDEMPVEKTFTLLSTKLFGDAKGESILILNERERRLISAQNLSISGTSVSIGETSFLLELANIVSASVTTEVSDELDLNIYGGVPSLLEINDGNRLRNYLHRDQLTFFIKGHFDIEGYKEVKPAFVFRMSEEILEVAGRTN